MVQANAGVVDLFWSFPQLSNKCGSINAVDWLTAPTPGDMENYLVQQLPPVIPENIAIDHT